MKEKLLRTKKLILCSRAKVETRGAHNRPGGKTNGPCQLSIGEIKVFSFFLNTK